MTFLLTSPHHASIRLSEDESEYLLRNNDIPVSKLCAIREYGESAKLNSGATICWSNNAGS